ncbi:response regulator transcription factor [Kineosporia mesophila]|uniref:Response regulator transcription factor n=1 Tax=Kineosporia mesophila TaxID=566012 RepID=A0ABP7AF22_9ACTN|nr:response regulator transcription factor [Kineosporia mesophila]
MRVAIADDSSLFRGGLKLLLGQVGVEVCLEASNADDLVDGLAQARPQVAILDIRMPPTYTREGLHAAARIRETNPGVGVLILSTYAETAYAAELFANGSAGRGYMLKDRVDDVGTLRDALVRIAAGESLVDATLVDSLIGHSRRQDALAALTVRERQVLRQMAEGRSNAGVAAVLNLSHKTVENYAASIFGKLDIPAGSDDNRRVLAVLSWLRAGTNGS